jgi:hypothetical protein
MEAAEEAIRLRDDEVATAGLGVARHTELVEQERRQCGETPARQSFEVIRPHRVHVARRAGQREVTKDKLSHLGA